jgi:hypothetical protein
MIPEGAGAIDVFAPFGTQGIVDGNQKLLQLESLDDQDQKSFEEGFGPKLEMGEEAVETGLVAFQTGVPAQSTDMPLTGLNDPGDCGRTKVGPASFGKSQTKTEDYFGKVRCTVVSNHGPFSCFCESVSHLLASENGLLFLSLFSLVNP